jgi:PAS domain S-box-containing protein
MIKFFSSFSFTQKYIFALSLIAIFSISSYLNLVQLIDSQSNDAKVINVSGKQRMLSQKIALFAITYKIKKLQETVELMEKAHSYLLSLDISDELDKIYFSKPVMLDEKVKKYIQSAKSILENRDGASLSYILKNSQYILKDLDTAVSMYQADAEAKTKHLKRNELFIVLFILVTLVLEALFIFRPANNSVKKATKELKSQKEYLNMITQINTNAIIAVDSKFNILTFNKSAENMFGFSSEEMLNTKLIDDRIIPMKFLDMHNAGLKNFMTKGKLKNKGEVFELEGKHKDGTLFPIRISFGIKIENNNKIVVANIQDTTKEKEKDSLIMQQSRFAAMGEMIGNIAHQWRQPLSSISAIASGAKLRYKNNLISDEELDATFVDIKEHTQYLSKTIDDFRDFFKENKKKEIFNLQEMINKSISLIKASYTANNIDLKLLVKEQESINILGSSGEFSQVMLNILNNAKDALGDKSNKKVLIEVFKENEFAIIKVLDSAGGIPNDIITKVFDPYFTTKHKSQGTGIGLFMSRKIIVQHFEGVIEARNTKFKIDDELLYGAEFFIKLKYT